MRIFFGLLLGITAVPVNALNQEYSPRGVLIFFDVSESGLSEAVSGQLLKAIDQKVGPIITTAHLLKNIFSENAADGDASYLYQQYREIDVRWLKNRKDNSVDNKKRKQIMLRALTFDESAWIIKQINYSLYLLIPKTYLQKNGIDSDEVQKYDTDKSVSPVELQCGFKVNHMRTVTIDHILSPIIKKNVRTISEHLLYLFKSLYQKRLVAQSFIQSLYRSKAKISDIFCVRSDYKEDVPKVVWSIYMLGHGLINHSIVGLGLAQFKEFLNFLEQKIYCRLLVYDSCYAAGTNSDILYKDAKTAVALTHSFPIITKALTDATIAVIMPIIQFVDNQLTIQKFNNSNFKQFFEEITMSEAIDYKKAIGCIFYTGTSNNQPQIRLPGTEWFSVMNVKENVVSIGSTLAKSRGSERPLDFGKFFKKSPRSLLLYASDVPFELKIDSIKKSGDSECLLDAIVSMIPGDAIHRIKKISSSLKGEKEIINLFMGIDNISPRKLFFVEAIQGRNEVLPEDESTIVLENVIVYNTPMNYYAPENQMVAYYSYGEEIYFIKDKYSDPRIATSKEKKLYQCLLTEASSAFATNGWPEQKDGALLPSSIDKEGIEKIKKVFNPHNRDEVLPRRAMSNKHDNETKE